MKVLTTLMLSTRSRVCRLKGSLFPSSIQSSVLIPNVHFGRLVLSSKEHASLGKAVYIPKESSFYHSVLEDDPKYSDTLITSKYFDSLLEEVSVVTSVDDITNLDIQSLYPYFMDVTRKVQSGELEVNSDKVMHLTHHIKKNSKQLTSNDIKKLLALLCLWPVPNKLTHKHLKSIILSLDTACISFILKNRNAPIEEFLILMEMWHWLNLCTISEYMQVATGKLFWRVEKHGHIVQLLLYMSELRNLPYHYDKPAIEKKVARALRYFKPNEIGIMAAGFYKTKTKITNYALYKQVVKRVVKDHEKFDAICLNAVLKLLRSCVLDFGGKADIEAVQEAILPRIPHLSGMCLVQLTMLGATMEVNNRSIMMSILENLAKQTSELREKDFQRIMYACAVSMDEDDVRPFINEIVSEIHRRGLPTMLCSREVANEEMNPKIRVSFIEIVLFLHIMGYRSPELIASAIESGLTFNVQPKQTAALQHLDAIVNILFPDYTGPRLHEETRKQHHKAWFPGLNIVFPAKHWFSFEWREVSSERLRKFYLDVCSAVGDASYVGCHSLLPLYEHKDLVVCQDSGGNFVPLPPTFGTEPAWEPKRPVGDDDKTFVVLMLLRDRSKNGVPDYTLYQRLRRELLEKLGYRIAVVRYTVFDDLPKDVKIAHIHEALKAAE